MGNQMRTYILLSIILVAAISCNSPVEKAIECAKTEGVSKLTGMVSDLLQSKMQVNDFVEKFLKWRTDLTAETIAKCVPAIPNGQSVLQKIGYTFLLSSNCEKDLGGAFIVLDQVVQSFQNFKQNWKNGIIATVFFGLLSKQAYADCDSAIQQIINMWRN